MAPKPLSHISGLTGIRTCGTILGILVFLLNLGTAGAQTSQTVAARTQTASEGMTFLFHADPALIEGLRRHDMLRNWGYRLHNTGLDTRPFGIRWLDNPRLQEARDSGRPYYLDRLCGGMPFQNLDGLETLAARLADDPNFLGFQVHEWGNSPIHDYKRTHKLILDKQLPFDREHFAPFEGRTDSPYFSSGDYDTYRELYRPLKTLGNVDVYLADFFRHMNERTAGQVMSVNGYIQLHHTAFRLGARHVMPEIGNQVPLTAVQIAAARGAARQFSQSFGVYYEPWGGKPFGCCCALNFSPWFPDSQDFDGKLAGHRIRPGLGSSRSLQRRLLYYAWLSGARYWAEEWGAENYFANWRDYPLTEYGRTVKEFLDRTADLPAPTPIVPAAVVLPAGTVGFDIRCLADARWSVHTLFEPDDLHKRLHHLAKAFFAPRPRRSGADDFNLTASPWIGAIDILTADAPRNVLAKYGLLIYLDEAEADAARNATQRVVCYQGNEKDAAACVEVLGELLPFKVDGEVGVVQARMGRRIVVGLFNNLGVIKTEGKETADPAADRTVTIEGPVEQPAYLIGESYEIEHADRRMKLHLPAGMFAVISFPE